jgi:co-chaperonin GroES (HSP10)
MESNQENQLDAYNLALKRKQDTAINLIKAKPETWTENEREIYKDLTLINVLMTNRMVLIKEINYKAESSSGIMLVQTTESKPLIIGMVVSIAPDCRFGIGSQGNKIEAADIKAGDIVMYAVYNGDQMDILGNSFFRTNDINIHAKIPESALAELIIDRTDHMWNIRSEMTWDKDNPNNIGPKSSYHIDHKSNK